MGLINSLDIPGCDDRAVFDKAFARLRKIDKRFSPFKKSSELSRYSRGELTEARLSREMKTVIKACKDWEKRTDGYFSAWFGGEFNPTGYVKGWAIAEAGKVVEKQGYKNYCLGSGGDILAKSDSAKVWIIGIQDPKNPSKILNKLSIKNGAVATSGTYERGEHIINPKTDQPARELLSITVAGPDIITADVLATAAFAMGKAGPDFVNKQRGYRALSIAREVIGGNISPGQAHLH